PPPVPPFATASAAETPPEPPKDAPLNGRLIDLIMSYRTHKDSPFHQVRFKTRENYDGLLRRMEPVGDTLLGEMNEEHVRTLYNLWSEDGKKKSTGHSFITLLRILANFGATVLKDDTSNRLAMTLHRMEFSVPEPRIAKLTRAHVDLIIAKAHEMNLH